MDPDLPEITTDRAEVNLSANHMQEKNVPQTYNTHLVLLFVDLAGLFGTYLRTHLNPTIKLR